MSTSVYATPLEEASRIKFHLASEVPVHLRIKIVGIFGNVKSKWIEEKQHKQGFNNNSYVVVKLCVYCDGHLLCQPRYSYYFLNSLNKNTTEWVTFPIRYEDIPKNSFVAFTVYDIWKPNTAVAIGGATYHLFNHHGTLRMGKHRVQLWSDREADPSEPSKTPGKVQNKREIDRLDKTIKSYERNQLPKIEWLDKLTLEYTKNYQSEEQENYSGLELQVEFPTFENRVIAHEKESVHQLFEMNQKSKPEIVTVKDPEIIFKKSGNETMNPLQTKHLKLSRSYQRKILDKDLKPDVTELREIQTIVSYPLTKHLTLSEKELLWKFRFYLTNNKKALTKFLKSIDWQDSNESKQAIKMMESWCQIDFDEALGLLSNTFTNRQVRSYAIKTLEKLSDSELLQYLLQLVEAIRYEQSEDSELVDFLLHKAKSNFELTNNMYWFIKVASDDVKAPKIYANVLKRLLDYMEQGSPTAVVSIKKQENMIKQLLDVQRQLKAMGKDRLAKIAKLKELLSSKEYTHHEPIPFPLFPKIDVHGLEPEKSNIFKSAMQPIGLKFLTNTKETPSLMIIVKAGDDLRQDQLVIQLMQLMDNLLKKENLDLKLTPYRVLATSSNTGFVECVTPSHSLASVLKDYGHDIQKYFRTNSPDPEGPYGIKAEVLDNFVKSCAGYCIITFLLGVGDRHLDNLLISPTGKLFHIDFGFILGRDPKPLPPPFKLCKEMVEGMGGQKSAHWLKFRQLCSEAYIILRKSSNLILNLVHLMVDASIPDISIHTEPDKALLKLQEKFRLDLTDEEAVRFVQDLIGESVTALFPVMIEYAHTWAQYWRS